MCFCQKLQLPICIGWTSFVLLPVRVWFCFGCIGIVSDPGLICCVFCWSFVFFWHNSCCLFAAVLFAHHWRAFHFLSFGGVFLALLVPVCFVRLYAWFVLHLDHVLCACFSFCQFFLTTWVRTCYVLFFLVRDYTCKTSPDHRFFTLFPLLSCPPPANTSHCTHENPCAPIRSRPCPSCLFFAKHDVRGNFPGHRGSKHALHDHFCLCLSCFCARCTPCTQTHLYEPIRTHLHPLICLFISVPIRTHLHASEYRYLFEKSKKIDKLIKTYQFNISNMINIYVSDLCILLLDPRKFY